MKYLRDQYPDAEFFFCLGSDLLRSLPAWEFGDKLINEFQARRGGIVVSRRVASA